MLEACKQILWQKEMMANVYLHCGCVCYMYNHSVFPHCAQKAEYKKKVCLVWISEECKQLLVSCCSLHKVVFWNYGWHISITSAMFVNKKHRYTSVNAMNRQSGEIREHGHGREIMQFWFDEQFATRSGSVQEDVPIDTRLAMCCDISAGQDIDN